MLVEVAPLQARRTVFIPPHLAPRRAERDRSRCRRGRRCRGLVRHERTLDLNNNWRACLKKPDGRGCIRARWCARIKPEIVQRPPPNRIGVWLLRKTFGVPSHRAYSLIDSPRGAAVSRIAHGSIMCPSGMLGWRVESDIGDDGESCINLEGLNRAIQVLVIDGVLIVINASRRAGYLGRNEYNPIVSGVGFDLGHGMPLRQNRSRPD